MTVATKFTSADLELMPDDGKRYELIEGELYVSRQPSVEHQYTCGRLSQFLNEWSDQNGQGIVLIAPGLIFAEDDDVAPDVVWISRDRLTSGLDEKGHLHLAPELAIEVLSPRIVDGMRQQIGVHRREQGALKHVATLYAQDTLETPLLPGFSCQLASVFFSLSAQGK